MSAVSRSFQSRPESPPAYEGNPSIFVFWGTWGMFQGSAGIFLDCYRRIDAVCFLTRHIHHGLFTESQVMNREKPQVSHRSFWCVEHTESTVTI